MHHLMDRIAHTMAFISPVVEHWLELKLAQWVHHEGLIHERTLPWSYISPYQLQERRKEMLYSADICHTRSNSTFYDWCNKGCGMCHPVCGMMHIKEPLLLIGKSSSCGGSGFPLSLSEWSFIICLMPYNRK